MRQEHHTSRVSKMTRVVGWIRSLKGSATLPTSSARRSAKTLGFGDKIGRYLIEDRLGQGASGTVYRALDQRLKRHVAVKILDLDLGVKGLRTRFEREARLASSLNHPAIVTVHDVGEHDGLGYLVMEHLEGQTLSEILADGRLGAERAIDLALQISQGLGAAHEAGLVHRDLKPANIMVVGNQAKLLDFGLAKLFDNRPGGVHEGLETITRDGAIIGTPAYMSPEQILSGRVGPSSDVFSLGVVLHEMFTGRRPFEGEDIRDILTAVSKPEPLTLLDLPDQVPDSIQNVIRRCLARSSTDRFSDAGQVSRALGATNPKAAVSSSVSRTLSKRSRPEKESLRFTAEALLKAAVASGLLIAGFWLWLERPDPPLMNSIAKGVVVLPFSSNPAREDLQNLAHGLAEVITSHLSASSQQHLPWVVPYSEARDGEVDSVREAGDRWGVGAALTGSILEEAGKLRLSISLTGVESMRQVGGAVIDVEAGSILGLQNRTLQEIDSMLGLMPTSGAGRDGSSISEVQRLYLEARGLLTRLDRAGNIDRALERLSTAIATEPRNASIRATKCTAHWRKYEETKDPRQVEQARDECEVALSIDSANIDSLKALALIETGTGSYSSAIRGYLAVLAREPRNADAHAGLAQAYELDGQVELAERTYRRAVEIEPRNWFAHNQLGVFYFRQAQYESALDQFLLITRLTPRNARAFSNAGGILRYLERDQEALEHFETAIEIAPTFQAYSNIGQLYFSRQDYEAAIDSFEQALELAPRDEIVLFNLASSYSALDNQEQAALYYEKVLEQTLERLEINPADSEILTLAAESLGALQRAEEASELIEKALASAPLDVEIMIFAAQSYQLIGRPERAQGLVRRAIEAGYPIEVLEQNIVLQDHFAEGAAL